MAVNRTILGLCLWMAATLTIFAQEPTFQSALELFEKKNFRESASQFAKLIVKNERDPKLNYYFGAALAESNQNIAESVKRLKFAQINKYGNDLAFYQGRAAQMNYEFDQAVEFYSRYQKLGKNKELLGRIELYLKQSNASRSLSSKFFDVKVVGSNITQRNNFLQFYGLSKDAGMLIPNADFFDSGVDGDDILYRTERGDAIYFSNEKAAGNKDLFRLEKLIDGWGDEIPLKELNSAGNDITPFVMTDGNTIYFASDREGGMGGLDIYKSTYDPEIRQFSEPVNLGVPFNSPFDDMLFVADEFKNKAWFASNRNTQSDSIEVFEIVWDNSVVRNIAPSTAAIREAALLKPDPMIARNAGDTRRPFTSDKRIAKPAEIFRFVVNDTLTYTDWNSFRSEEAKADFEKSYHLQLHKDSLSAIMAGHRRIFATTNSEKERNDAVNEIIKMEREVYGIDEQIERQQIRARLKEIASLKEGKPLLRPSETKGGNIDAKPSEDDKKLNDILIPSNFTYYTDEEFERQINEWNLMYQRLFDSYDVAELQAADSMYVWGNILTLESSRLNEQLLKNSTLNGAAALFAGSSGDENIETIKKNAREYKKLALRLYHKALDTKFRVFSNKINEIKLNDEGLELPEFDNKYNEAVLYYKKALEQEQQAAGNTEMYEKAGTIKRQSIYLLNDALFLYLGYIDGSATVPVKDNRSFKVDSDNKNSEKRAFEIVSQPVKEAPKPAKEQEIATSVNSKPAQSVASPRPEYRVQLGVFRNQPKQDVLSQLPKIQSVPLAPGQGSKYYCGQFATYAEAVKVVPVARSAGFDGAFVVAFLNGEQIAVAKAKELE